MANTLLASKVGSSNQISAIARSYAGATGHGLWHADSAAGCGFVSPSANLVIAVAAVPAAGAIVNGVVNSAYAGGTVTIVPDVSVACRHVVVMTNAGAVSVVKGTPSATPARPTLTAGQLALGEVLTAANASQVVAGDITDARQQLYGVRFLPKTASQTYSGTTLTNDTHWFISVEPTEVWEIRLMMQGTFAAAGGLDMTVTYPAGGVAFAWQTYFAANNQTTLTGVLAGAAQISTSGVRANIIIPTPGSALGTGSINGLYTNGATGGTLQFQFSQNVASGTTTINGTTSSITASFMVATRLK